MTEAQHNLLHLLGAGAIVVLVFLSRWRVRKQKRYAAGSKAFMEQQWEERQTALQDALEIVDKFQLGLEERTGQIMLLAPERMRPPFLTILNEELDDNRRYSKADFILSADAIFRAIALDWQTEYAQKFPAEQTTSAPNHD